MPDLKAKARGGVPVVFKIVSTLYGLRKWLSRQTRLELPVSMSIGACHGT